MLVGRALPILLGLIKSAVCQQQFSPVPSVFPTSRPPTLCLSYQATCNNGDCVDKAKVCDGSLDCSDGSDESGCRPYNECEPNEYQCENQKCVLKTWRCDGDDDCGDGTDEANCQENPPSSPCRYYEWQCASGDQCIPKSFHCDGEMDCQDQSDEIGCTGPVIVVSPPPSMLVEQSYTFVINCTAMGIPTPEIVWRLNWGHVPEKCSMTSTNQGGNRAYGELTCSSAQKQDSGAYSCEAINSMGSCFAGSAGCGQPGQDAIVVISGEGAVCPAGSFNSQAVSAEDCISCDCARLTDICSSADLYLAQLPPPAGIFQLVTRNPATLETSSVRRLAPILSGNSQRLYAQTRSFLPDNGVPYFSLPSSHTGNQLKSYGGYFRFSLSFAGEGNLIDEPLIVIQGQNKMLAFYRSPALRPGVETNVEARLWPGQWFIDYRGGNRATRRDILRVLSDIQYLLIRAQHVDAGPIDSTISNILLDTADTRDTGAGSVVHVEQCICPPGYTGLSCESCAPGYDRTATGTCRRPAITCPTGYYEDPDNGECLVCPCPLTIPSNQFGRSCRIDSDRQVTCECSTGYTGRRCGDCAPGFVGNPAIPGGSCTPGPVCNYPEGSLDRSPDPSSGRCRCKAGYTGESCRQAELSRCQDFTFLSREESVPGCIECFCSGIPTGSNRTSCQPSQLFRYKETAVFQEDNLGFSLSDKYLEEMINSTDLILNKDRQELSYDRFEDDPQTVFFWRLPYQFLGNKLTSYGGFLEFTLRYIPVPGVEEPAMEEPLVQIQGNDISLFHSSPAVLKTNDGHRFKVKMYEKDWRRFDGGESNREHLLMALANLDHILIRATHSPSTRESGISEVRLDCGVNRTTQAGTASAVEGCICPEGYKGLSCEECAPGYTRSGSGLYLGTCEPCNCNRKSSTCDPVTGVCLDCRDFTTGRNCEECLEGYFKDRRSGGCVPMEGSQSSCSCDPRGSLDLACINTQYCRCKENVEGLNCDRCKPGTFSLTSSNPAGCNRCHCSGVTDECSDARLFWSTLRLNSYDKKYVLTDRSQRIVKENELRYNEAKSEMVYQMQDEDMNTEFYWRLPQEITGNKIGAYAGNLTIIQRYVTRNRGRVLNRPDVILNGGGLTLNYGGLLAREEGVEMKYKVPMLEEGWVVEERGRERPATREDMLAALGDIQSLLVRGSVSEGTVETGLRKTMLDIGVPQMTGGPLVEGAEECRCPPGYSGFSCESCSIGFYRDWSGGGRCVRCPCQGNEEGCRLLPSRQVECTCKAGFSGQACEYRGETEGAVEAPIKITMLEPRIQIVEVGKTVRFNCAALPTFATQEPTTIAWAKENGILPPSRANDNGEGLLIISSVRSEDSGTYICTATTGRFVNTDKAVLKVGGPDTLSVAPVAGIVPAYQQLRAGDALEINCNTFGNPPPTVTWTKDNYSLGRQVIVRGATLYIGSVSKQDEGEYTCYSENIAGKVEARAQIYISGDDSGSQTAEISISPQDLSIAVGDTAMFDCQVTGTENYQTKWSRSQGQLPYSGSESSGRLTIAGVRPEDSGMYVCRATGPSGDVMEAQARLVVSTARGPPSVRIEPEEQTIGQGSSTEIRCIGFGDPLPALSWSKVGEDLSSPNLEVSGNVLSLKTAAVSDRGMYICNAENAGGSARASAIIEVERRELPKIEIYPDTSQTITVSGSVLFQCRTVAGIPTPAVTWSRVDGRPLHRNVETLGGGVLRINQVTGDEQGQYICKAQNEVGSTETVANLVIQEIPSIQLEPKGSVTMQVGTKLSIVCKARGDPAPTVSWKKIGTATRDLGVSQPTFEVEMLTKEDEGTYACVATNVAGQIEERVQIIVLEAEEYLSYPQNVDDRYPAENNNERYPEISGSSANDLNARAGSNVKLDCMVVGTGAEVTGQWRRGDGQRLPTRHYQDNGVLNLVDVDEDDEGTYICEMIDSRGSIVFQIEKQIFLASPPRITLNPTQQTVNPGDSPRVTCSATGKQPIRLTWRREDGSQLPNSVFQDQGVLEIRRISVRDQGRYTCTATNPDGEGTATAEVMINDYGAGFGENAEPERITASIGASVDLPCRLPRGSAVTWRKDGGALPASSRQIQTVLRIDRVTEQDTGRYICSGPAGTQYTLLSVQRMSTIREKPSLSVVPSVARPYVDGSLDLRCEVSGDQLNSSKLSWSKVGGELPGNVRTRDNLIRFVGLTAQNQGLYRCKAQTPMGIFYADYNLLLSLNGQGRR